MSAVAEIARAAGKWGRATPGVRKPTRREWLRVKFWWATYSPQDAFQPWEAPEVPVEGKSLNGGLSWRQMRGGGRLEPVRDFMVLHGLRVLSAEVVAERKRAEKWEGLYVVVIGQQGGAV
jgi:hypothetical protein